MQDSVTPPGSAADAPLPFPPSTPTPTPPRSRSIDAHPIVFRGDGGVYFGVWIVNVLLTIITLGLYTPWARRRTIRYFYAHTEVAGQALEFTAGIRAMVVGFLLFAGFYIAMEVAGNTGHDAVAGLILIGGALLAPWLWGAAMRFRLGHTRWRGLRLHFGARWREVYGASWPVFVMAAVWLAAGLALSQMVGTAQDEARADTAATQRESGREAPDAKPQGDGAQAAEDGSEEDAAAPDPDADAEPDADAATDPDAEAEDKTPLPRPTWAMGGVVLAAAFLSLLCFIRLEFNYKRLLVTRTRIGGQTGRWKPVFGDFVRVWVATLGVFVLCVAAITVVGAIALGLASLASTANELLRGAGRGFGFIMLLIVIFTIAFFAMFLAGSPALAYRQARMFQLMWNNIGLGQVARFRSDLRPRAFVWLRIKNILLGMITFGLYRPFARVAEYRMKAESVTLHTKGDLDRLVGQMEAQQKDGFGDAVADALGLDLIG